MPLPTVPVRTPMFDDVDNLTRPWVLFFQALAGGMGGGYVTVTPDGSGNVTLDLTRADTFLVTLGATALTILAPGSTAGAGTRFWLHMNQDSTGGRDIPAFAGGAGGFVSTTQTTVQMDGTASTQTSVQFTLHANGYWSVDSVITGKTLT